MGPLPRKRQKEVTAARVVWWVGYILGCLILCGVDGFARWLGAFIIFWMAMTAIRIAFVE